MKLVSYDDDGETRFGAVVGESIVDMARASAALAGEDGAVSPLPADIETLLARNETLDASARAVVARAEAGTVPAAALRPLAGTRLLPPVPRPTKIICVARNYAEHAREAGLQISEIPIIFARFANTQIGEGDTIAIPAVSDQIDWEGELAIVLGKPTRGRIGQDGAMDYVYGYTIFNDVTARDYQFRVTQYTSGKNFRRSGPCGPWLVTKDEIADPHKLQITTRINGVQKQSANTDTMIFDIPTILEHIADFIDLEAGDLIPTGTPAGVGFKRKPPEFLKAGDVIEVEVEGIGTLTNPVANEADIA